MNSLRFRLLGAFALIILAVLALVGLALLVLLRDNPAVERPVFTRLNETARLILLQNSPSREALTNETAYVKALAEAYEVRVLIVTNSGEVRADTQPADPLNFLELRNVRPEGNLPGVFTGRARNAQQQVWLFVTRNAGPGRLLVLAAPQPRFAALTYFLENLLGPLCQAGAIAALVAVLLAALIARSIARPLQKMASVAHGIARGDYTQAAPVSGPDEVQALGQSLNDMSRQVQATQHAQRDFVANISHELKTPLTSIQGFAQALGEGLMDSPDGTRRSAQIIYDEAQRLRRLVDELLDLARLEAGLRNLNRAPLDPHTLLLALTHTFGPRAHAKQVALTAHLPASLPTLIGDADRLAQVFTNLLDNALKHTPLNGAVTLTATVASTHLTVTISDTGPGIPPEDLSRIFERFYQVDKSRSRSAGVGLGLAITKEIVEAHGGQVSVASPPGQGAQFSVVLPLTRPDDAQATLTLARKQKAPAR